MGWNEIKNRIEEPLLTSDGINEILKSCFKENGQNTRHSRSIKIGEYREPAEADLTEDDIKELDCRCDIVRYMAESLLKEYNEDATANDRINWICYTDKIDEIKYVLKQTSKMSNEQIKKLANGEIHCFVKDVYDNCANLVSEHNGEKPPYQIIVPPKEKGTHNGYNKRIYLNTNRNMYTVDFLVKYIKKCIDRKIPFDMKGFGSPANRVSEMDGTILYSNNEYLNEHIDIIEEIIRENPELMKKMGTPIYTGAMIKNFDGNCYYTITSGMPFYEEVLKRPMGTYNDYIDTAINNTYLIGCGRIIKYYINDVLEDFKRLDERTKNLVKDVLYYYKCDVRKIKFLSIMGKEQIREMREFAYKIIESKKETGTIEEKQQVMKILKNTFTHDFKTICSYLKFEDNEHLDCPIYQDGKFIEFEEMNVQNSQPKSFDE